MTNVLGALSLPKPGENLEPLSSLTPGTHSNYEFGIASQVDSWSAPQETEAKLFAVTPMKSGNAFVNQELSP